MCGTLWYNALFAEFIIALIPVSLLLVSFGIMIYRRVKGKKMLPFVISSAAFALLAVYPVSAFVLDIISPPPPPQQQTIGQLPDIRGMNYEECKENSSEYFSLEKLPYEYSSEYPEGTIIDQTPPAGSDYIVGRTTVKCTVSKGPRMLDVPNIIGLDYETVKELLEDIGFKAGFVFESSDEYEKGKVISSEPAWGEKVPYGSAVKLTISTGKEDPAKENN